MAGYLNSSRVRCITGQPVIVRARKDNAVEISSSYGDWKAAFTTQAAEELAHRIGLAAQAIQRRAA
ncbi:MAG: hypothetical protein J2O48_02590 [Solirubrobacterales bacterium]|nr:hypothetical protein [Solirubrobacterales bacterium]